MTEPIRKGDLAIIVAGKTDPSPNLNKIVTVGQHVGEHSVFGRVVRVHSHQLILEDGVTSNWADTPVAWLKKIEPPPVKAPETKATSTV